MPSPFPGMNPFLEQNYTWNEFHNEFLVRSRELLVSQVGSNYVVKLESHLVFHDVPSEERGLLGIADLGVSTVREPSPQRTGVATLEAPVQLELTLAEFDVENRMRLEIRDRRDRRVITVVELLSPSNKTPGRDREAYLAKRRQVLGEQVNFVEIDLRRGGLRPELPELPPCDYYALVCRYYRPSPVGFWPIGLRDPLPVLPIPLEVPDPDARLDLKAAVDRTYDAAGYANYIYLETPEPPLRPEDAEWARQLIPNRA